MKFKIGDLVRYTGPVAHHKNELGIITCVEYYYFWTSIGDTSSYRHIEWVAADMPWDSKSEVYFKKIED